MIILINYYLHFLSIFQRQQYNIFYRILVTAPLFFTAIGTTLGIVFYWHKSMIFCVLPLFLIFWSFGSRFLKLLLWQQIYIFYLPIVFFGLGFFSAYKQDKNFLWKQNELCSVVISVRGVVRDIEKTTNPLFPYEITLKVREYSKSENSWTQCMTLIRIMTKKYGSFSVGDYIEISGISSKKADQKFGYFLMKEDIAMYVFVPQIQGQILSRPLYSMQRFLYRKRCALYQAIRNYCTKKTIIFFKMLFLGKKDRSDESEIIDDYFKRWGIVHMTARSGMHMTLYVFLCAVIFRVLPLPFVAKQIVLLICSIIYALFSYPTVSFVRAYSTSLCLIICHCIRRRSNFLHLTLATYSIQLLVNPMMLFFLDFQLSFLLSIGIGFFSKSIFINY